MNSCRFHTLTAQPLPPTRYRRAVFLDKDGTLIEDIPYNVDPLRIQLTANAAEGLRTLYTCGYALIVISNQSGVARGYFTESALRAVEQRLDQLLVTAGVQLTDFYYCPHHPHGSVQAYARECWGRKPAPGLILKAAQEHGIDVSESWFIGDILDDIEAGRRAGCRTVLLDNGHETEGRVTQLRSADFVASSVQTAAEIIVANAGRSYANIA